jgi:hypothetical protein
MQVSDHPLCVGGEDNAADTRNSTMKVGIHAAEMI